MHRRDACGTGDGTFICSLGDRRSWRTITNLTPLSPLLTGEGNLIFREGAKPLL